MSGGCAQRRWRNLPPGATRDEFFAALHDALAEHYLAEPDNPYRMSGRSGGAEGWERKRRCIAEAVHRDGSFMDVGCANGLLLETLAGWVAERGFAIEPHGIDFVAELIAHARRRHPAHQANFEVANAFYWQPTRRYDFVRVGIECVPTGDRPGLVRRLYESALAPGGRLIGCYYRDRGAPEVDLAAFLAGLGLAVAGRSRAPGVSVAWLDRPPD